jgi:hypothetical protein
MFESGTTTQSNLQCGWQAGEREFKRVTEDASRQIKSCTRMSKLSK